MYPIHCQRIFATLLLSLAVNFTLHAQGKCPYHHQLVIEGDAKFRTSDFRAAIDKYQAAITDCPELAFEVEPKVIRVFNKIDRLRVEAIDAKDSLHSALILVEKTQADLTIALQEAKKQRDLAFTEKALAIAAANEIRLQESKNQKLVNAFYFFEDSLALAYRDGKFGYVNKAGEVVIPYQFDKAANFEAIGFARVEIGREKFLLDRQGKPLRAHDARLFDYPKVGIDTKFTWDFRGTKWAYFRDRRMLEIRKHTQPSSLRYKKATQTRSHEILISPARFFGLMLQSKTTRDSVMVLDLGNNNSAHMNQGTFDFQNLEVLLLDGNQITRLYPNFTQLAKLRHLDLSNNRLEVLPSEIKRLPLLEALSIGHNPCSDTPEKRAAIRKQVQEWLPGCKVTFK